MYMVLFQSSFVILCSTHDRLQQFLAFRDLYIQTNLRNKFLKEPQTISIYWFYLLHNYVVMSTKSK